MNTLNALNKGERCRIIQIDEKKAPIKLIELGFLPDEVCTLVNKAPTNDPIYVRISGSAYALRKAEADCIYIEKI